MAKVTKVYELQLPHGEVFEFSQDELDQAVTKFERFGSAGDFNSKEVIILSSKAGGRRVELIDPTPMAPPVGFMRTEPLHIQIRNMVRSEQLRAAAEAAGMDTFEEADDFDVGDDDDIHTPWEAEYEPVSALLARKAVLEAEEKAAQASAAGGRGGDSPQAASPTEQPSQPSQSSPTPLPASDIQK